jgi:Plant transposon protein
MVDHNLWFWHASVVVGHAGTQSDTNIWDVPPLLQVLLTEELTSTRDFKFVLDGQEFDTLWILADGAYPPIARFVKTISFPIGDTAKEQCQTRTTSPVTWLVLILQPCYYRVDQFKERRKIAPNTYICV